MKPAFVVLLIAFAVVLLLVGADRLIETTDLWIALRSTPRGFVNFLSQSFYDYRLWTLLATAGVLAAIVYINGVPTIRQR